VDELCVITECERAESVECVVRTFDDDRDRARALGNLERNWRGETIGSDHGLENELARRWAHDPVIATAGGREDE